MPCPVPGTDNTMEIDTDRAPVHPQKEEDKSSSNKYSTGRMFLKSVLNCAEDVLDFF